MPSSCKSISLFKLSCEPESLFLVSNLKNYEIEALQSQGLTLAMTFLCKQNSAEKCGVVVDRISRAFYFISLFGSVFENLEVREKKTRVRWF